MNQDKSEEILEAITKDKYDKIILEIESLKPWKYSWIIGATIQAALFIYIFIYMQDDSIFLDTKYILIMLVVLFFGNTKSDSNVHKRMDALLHLVNTKSSSSKKI